MDELQPSSFAIASGATVSNPGNVNRQSAFSVSAAASVSNPGAAIKQSAFSVTAGATVENPGSAIKRSAFVISGSSSVVFSGESDGSSSFSIAGSSSVSMVGAAISESPFEIEGTSFVDMKSPTPVSSSFTITSSSSVMMYSPILTVTTLVDGSGGDPDGGAEIDWTICDFANIELSAGTGSYPIDHINLIAGKKISVHVHNNANATGTILWDGGDAPVNWIGLDASPDMPANGESLHVEFECNEDRTEIFGRLFVDEEVYQTLAQLDRRYGRTLFDRYEDAGNVGTDETTLYSNTIPADTLIEDGDKIVAEYAVVFATSVNNKQVKVYFPSSVVIFDTGSLAIATDTDCQLRVTIIRQTASTARAVVAISTLPVSVGDGETQITDEADLSGINFSFDNSLIVAGIGGATDDVIARLGFGEFKPSAS